MVRFILLSILICLPQSTLSQTQLPKPIVKVSKRSIQGGVIYQYRVVNNTPDKLGVIQIGYDRLHGGLPELKLTPVGFNLETRQCPSSSYTSPDGWKFNVFGQEETDNVYLQWETDSVAKYVLENQGLSGFNVVVPHEDSSFEKASFSIAILNKGFIFGVVQLEDASSDNKPPEITVSVSPNTIWPPNGKMIPIQATISVKDDVDPSPVVKLESITCNDNCDPSKDIKDAAVGTNDRQFSVAAIRLGKRKDGRVYTIKYSATDSTGNKVEKSVVVSVPHDKR